MTYLTNENRPPPARGLCPGCYGWGFPIMFLNGKEAYNTHVRCPDCEGTGKAPDPSKEEA